MLHSSQHQGRLAGSVRPLHLALYVLAVACCTLLAIQGSVASAAAVDNAPEVWYVRGCHEATSRDARETTGCFAAATTKSGRGNSNNNNTTPQRSVHLSLQGVHLPTDLEGHRVLLSEYRRPSLLGEEASPSSAHDMDPVLLLCEHPEASELFPTQLITCEVVHPLLTMSNSDVWRPKLKRLLDAGVMWFDVRLEVQDGSGDSYRTLSVLRRAVQLHIANTSATDNTTAGKQGQQRRAVSWEEVRQHPLERLYTPDAVADPSAASASSSGAAGEKTAADVQNGEEVWVELGIGGLKRELRSLFRRVFLSRLPSLAPLAEALDLQHVRGVILYGPPGNGKTLIARNLFRLLGPNTRLSVVNAADILSKYVGESEKNLRDVFEGYDIGTSSKLEDDAKDNDGAAHPSSGASQKEKDAASAPGTLQVLVIDEFEALFRRRGNSADESSAKAVYDGVTNTLLSLMDGVKSRNDLLVVGLTNRLQAIDQALLRPGRFEVLIEIPAPDVPGREDIFFIHTDRLREHNFLAADVDLHTLALESGGFSGSDIAGTVRSAVSYALLRYRKEGLFSEHGGASAAASAAGQGEELGHRSGDVGGWGWGGDQDAAAAASASSTSSAAFEVTRADFERAMRDIRSAKDEASALSQLSTDGDGAGVDVVDHDGTVSRNIERAAAVMGRVLQSDRTVSGIIAVTGAPGTGKSTIARALTRVHDFTTVRYFACRRLSELRDREEQLAKLRDALSEASHTERGLVVLDDYDVLMDAMGSSSYAGMTLHGLLYEYLHRPGGVSRALVADSPLATAEGAGGEAEAGNMVVNAGSRVGAERNRRVLVLTASLASSLQSQSFDVHLRVHPVLRRGAATLLEAYRVVDPEHAAAVAAAYPVSMSYRTFLRVTDLALQRWVEHDNASTSTATATAAAAATGEENEAEDAIRLPAFFATSPSMRSSYATLQAEEELMDFYTVTTDDARRDFAAAVRVTVANMGLMDPYEGWKGEGDEDEVEEGAEEWEGEGGFDVDAVVGAADELLW